jgi:DNA-binding transcriptional LysR family regulator
MLSLKQLEAVYWVARLGTFGAAAERLFTTQSAISKRVNELEFFLQIPLFDRSRRSVQLTAKGRELLEGAEEMLQLRDRLLERMGKEVEIVRRFRLGITELIALTFLPRLVQDIRLAYPTVSLEPEIDVSANLVAKLARGDIGSLMALKYRPREIHDEGLSRFALHVRYSHAVGQHVRATRIGQHAPARRH